MDFKIKIVRFRAEGLLLGKPVVKAMRLTRLNMVNVIQEFKSKKAGF